MKRPGMARQLSLKPRTHSACPRVYCGIAQEYNFTAQKPGGPLILRRGQSSRISTSRICSGGAEAMAGFVAPPVKLVQSTVPSGARPGKRDEFQNVPNSCFPAERGTRN